MSIPLPLFSFRSRVVAPLLFASLLLTAVACSGDSADTTDTTDTVDTVDTVDTADTADTADTTSPDADEDTANGDVEGSSDTADTADAEVSETVLIPSSGGTVEAAGVTIEVPEGAVPADTEITVTVLSEPLPLVPLVLLTPVYRFEPAGLEFAEPVQVSIPLDGSEGGELMFWSVRESEGTGFRPIQGRVVGTRMVASVEHFSEGFVAADNGDFCWDEDADGYGFGASCSGPDCDDLNAAAYPGGVDACGGGNDCDGSFNPVGVGLPCVTELSGPCQEGITVCGDGVVECVPLIEPTPELCDGIDNDCNGQVDGAAADCSFTDSSPRCADASVLLTPRGLPACIDATCGYIDFDSRDCGIDGLRCVGGECVSF